MKLTTEDEASKRCCQLLRKMFLSEEENSGTVFDSAIIARYSDEWGLMMQVWKETKEDLEK